jgi:nucleotide-binding universal stress UspA family protein
MLTVRKILCATDFSEASYVALEPAGQLAAYFGAELLLVHVVPYAVPRDLSHLTRPQAEKQICSEALNKMQRLYEEHLAPYGRARYLVRIGDADTEILKLADEEAADLIVMASHGQSGWRSVVFGSVTEAVLRNGSHTMLTVPVRVPAHTAIH